MKPQLPSLLTLDFCHQSRFFHFTSLPFLVICLAGGSSFLALLLMRLTVLADFCSYRLDCFIERCLFQLPASAFPACCVGRCSCLRRTT